ncbi:MAG TPA: hypothetical protein PKH33_13375 [bacterium]|nr:hypothetical protein [bacterium]
MELYTEKVTLPSGLECTIREMTATEEGFLASQKMLKSGEAFEKILRNCVVEKDIDLDNLLVGDRYYLMLAIRRLTYGDDYDFKVRCASCGQTFNMSVNLAELPIKKLEGDPDATHTITLPRTGKKVTFRLLRGRDEKKIAATLRKTPQEIIRLSLYLHTVAVDGNENFSEKFFETLPGADSQYYRREIDAVTCGVDTVVEVECPECDNEFEVQLPISENFFFPNSRKT